MTWIRQKARQFRGLAEILGFMSTRRRLLRFLTLFAALCLGGFRCDRPPAQPGGAKTAPAAPEKLAPLPAPDVSLLILTDPKGYLEPCGCQQRPLGGVDKLATIVAQTRGDGHPTAMLAAGDLLFGADLHGEDQQGARTQELWKAQTLAEIWSSLGMRAAAPGSLDFDQGAEVTADLRKRCDFPWLSENLTGADPALPPTQLLKLGSHTVGVVGSHASDPAHPWPTPLKQTPAEGLAESVQALKAQGADLVVALHVGDRRSARQVARTGAQLVVLGGLDEQEAFPPVAQGDAVIVHAGRQGQGVLRVDLSLKGEGPLVDVSEWSLSHRREALNDEAEALSTKIAAWEKDPAVKKTDLQTQRERFEKLRAQAAGLRRPSHGGRWLSATFIELDPDVPSDGDVAARVDAYDQRVNSHNREALASRRPAPAPAGQPHYVGSRACGACHAEAVTWWQTTKHGNAYATLERVHKEFNLSCVGCHVTGYNEPGGSTVTHVDHLQNVGCESCHGAGSQHVEDPAARLLPAAVPERQCVTCHNEQHSSRFDYEPFRALLRAPGHGQPLLRKAAEP